MKTSIEKTTNGAVKIINEDADTIYGIANATNVSIQAGFIKNYDSANLPGTRTKTPSIEIALQPPLKSLSIPFEDLVNINGVPKPSDIQDAVALLTDEVFNG